MQKGYFKMNISSVGDMFLVGDCISIRNKMYYITEKSAWYTKLERYEFRMMLRKRRFKSKR